jgi:hypothetical protein
MLSQASRAPDLISTTIADFCRLSGLGRSRVYIMLADGTLESIKIGKRRLILIDSYRKLIDHQRVARS